MSFFKNAGLFSRLSFLPGFTEGTLVETQDIERRPTAILAADVVDYSRLIGDDEDCAESVCRSERDEGRRA